MSLIEDFSTIHVMSNKETIKEENKELELDL